MRKREKNAGGKGGLGGTLCGAAAALALLLAAAVGAAALEKPTAQFYAADYANVLTADHEGYFVDQGAALQEATGAQIVVATVPSLEGQTVEEYANALFRSWEIGDKAKNNGLLVLLAPVERKIRVEVGYGLEGAINDAKASRMIDDYALSYLEDDDFDSGIYNLYNALLPAVYEEYGMEPPGTVGRARPHANNSADGFNTLLIIAVLIIFFSFYSRRHRVYRGYMAPRYDRHGHRRGGGGFGPGGFGPGSFGGGFGGGGGGGGFSGGGGSSGGGGGSRSF